jgi:hypothetical protein
MTKDIKKIKEFLKEELDEFELKFTIKEQKLTDSFIVKIGRDNSLRYAQIEMRYFEEVDNIEIYYGDGYWHSVDNAYLSKYFWIEVAPQIWEGV